MSRPRISVKAASFTESVIREMNRLAVQHGAVSLAQGFPDFACPPELKDAAAQAVHDDINQYAITWGAKALRDAIATSTPEHFPAWGAIDPETMITVTCGATEAMVAAMLALLDPGDEVVVFEPYYENYGPDAILSGAVPRYVTFHEPDWSIDPDELRAAFGPRTRAIVRQLAAQPDRQGVHARGARAHRRTLRRVRCHRVHRRHLRAHRVRGRAHPARDDRGDGRSDGLDPLDVEVVLGHRVGASAGRSRHPT